ncbi:hypothetical protein [Spongiimicrobium salis]|uniref:hypothetical protein n=1 Tax=Spongiimicrobium salis TaxID=1667022 RepID=UPI00374D8C3C
MELQELKSVWTKVVNEEHIKYEFNQDKVQEMIHQKSNTVLAKVERKLKYKRWFSGITGGLAILLSPAYLFLKEDSNYILNHLLSTLEIFGIMLLLGISLIFLCILLDVNYKKVKRQRTTSDGLKVTLKKVKDLLKRIMNFTIILDVTVVPLIAFLVLYRIFFGDQAFLLDSRVLYIVLGTVITFLCIRNVSKRQQEQRFGSFVKNLEDCISDMDALDDSPKK